MKPKKEVFESLVREHHAAAYRAAMRLVANEDDALDVVQKVFLAVLEGKVDLAAADSPRALLIWLSVKGALTHLRSARRFRRKEAVHAMERTEWDDDRGAMHADEKIAMKRSIARLPEDLRLAIQLRFQEGFTFAQIAEATRCSEPTAHIRVQKGLEKLRAELSRSAFASAALGLEKAIGAAGDVMIPAKLEGSLLALKAAAPLFASAATLPMIAITTVAAVFFTFVALRHDDRKDDLPKAPIAKDATADAGGSVRRGGDRPGAAVDLRASADNPRISAANDAPESSISNSGTPPLPNGATGGERSLRDEVLESMSATATDQESAGTIVGRLVDERGIGVAEALVFAESREYRGKLPRFYGKAMTTKDGEFRISVPVPEEEGREYLVRFRHVEFVPFTSEFFTVKKRSETTLEPIRAILESDDREAPWTISLTVLDERGRPCAGVWASAHRTINVDGGKTGLKWESGSKTDDAGVAVLKGARIGEKTIVVDGRHLGLSKGTDTFHVAEGDNRAVLRLSEGMTIAGRIELPEGSRLHGVQIFAIGDDTNDWRDAAIDASGSFKIIGLENRPHTVRVQTSSEFSGGRIDGVRAGESDLVVRLKRQWDTSDSGIHDAEFHGMVRDAATREEIAWKYDEVEYEWIEVAKDVDMKNDFFPNRLAARPVQTAQTLEIQTESDGTVIVFEPPTQPDLGFHFTGIGDGNYVVVARCPGYAPSVLGPFDTSKRTIFRDLVFDLRRGATIEGRVVNAGGQPVVGARVFLTGTGPFSTGRFAAEKAQAEQRVRNADRDEDRNGPNDGTATNPHLLTDASGRFRFSHVPTDMAIRVAVVLANRPATFSERLSLDDGAATTVTVTMN